MLWLILKLCVVIVHKTDPVEEPLKKYLQKKDMAPTPIHEEIVATIGESAVSYGLVKPCCRDFKCGKTCCENQHASGPSIMVTTDKNFKKVPDERYWKTDEDA